MSTPKSPKQPGHAPNLAIHSEPPNVLLTSRKFHQTWCPYRQATLLQQALTGDKMRVGFLLGAGCAVSVRVTEGSNDRPLIPDISGLTQLVSSSLRASSTHARSFSVVLSHLRGLDKINPTVEDVLTHVRSLQEIIGSETWDGLTRSTLNTLDEAICDQINTIVSVHLPEQNTPYHQLATWIGAIQRTNPVEIFTTNYDLLMEQALVNCRVPYFDGFVGSDRTFFDLASMEQDHLPPRWARLWKIHGSINWWQTGNDVERTGSRKVGSRLLIHPSHLKYDQSRRMPYLAMLDRLRSFLGRNQAILVTSGYSFADQHLNEVIFQGLSSNPTATCFGLIFGDRGNSEAVMRARKHANLSLLAVDGAVRGTIDHDWSSNDEPTHPLHAVAVKTGDFGSRSKSPVEQSKFLLGDFVAFGNFLAHQLAHRGDEERRGNVT